MKVSVCLSNYVPLSGTQHILKVKMVKIPLLVMLHCTFTMYKPKVRSTSQWRSCVYKERTAPPGQSIALEAFKVAVHTSDVL